MISTARTAYIEDIIFHYIAYTCLYVYVLMNGVLGHYSALLRLYLAEDNLGELYVYVLLFIMYHVYVLYSPSQLRTVQT